MKIRTRLNLPSLVSLALLLVMAPLLFMASNEFRKASNNDLLFDDIQRTVSEMSLLRNNYLLVNQAAYLAAQWQAKSERLARLINGSGQRFSGPEYGNIFNDMKINIAEIQAIFTRVVANREKQHQSEKDRNIGVALERRLLAQLLFKSYLLLDGAQQLNTINTQRTEFARNRLIGLFIVLFVGLAGINLATSFMLNRTLRRRIDSLRALTARISQGDLAYRIQISGKDELSELSQTFNEMAAKLQSSYELLEDEIEERMRTEQSLLESEQFLRQKEERIEGLNRELRQQVIKMQEANHELESFSYSVSHDLRAPLRHIIGFVEKLLKLEQGNLGEKSSHCLDVISTSASKMGALIDDLLSFSRMGRAEMMRDKINFMQLAQEVMNEIQAGLPDDLPIDWQLKPLPDIMGDRSMLRQVLVNLISNAVKFSQKTEKPQIEIGCRQSDEIETVYYVKDNGAGFDMKYAGKLFTLFQRLHSPEEYEGTGVGLANVRRIINRHAGRIWAEGQLNQGATFYFALPNIQKGEADNDN